MGEMRSGALVEILRLLEAAGIAVWLDGGWGVDALLGRQTRSHKGGVYRMANGADWLYPAEGFRGRGIVNGQEVSCLSAEVQVLCHADGYVPSEKDLRDMALLEERFGVELPPQLRADAGRGRTRG